MEAESGSHGVLSAAAANAATFCHVSRLEGSRMQLPRGQHAKKKVALTCSLPTGGGAAQQAPAAKHSRYLVQQPQRTSTINFQAFRPVYRRAEAAMEQTGTKQGKHMAGPDADDFEQLAGCTSGARHTVDTQIHLGPRGVSQRSGGLQRRGPTVAAIGAATGAGAPRQCSGDGPWPEHTLESTSEQLGSAAGPSQGIRWLDREVSAGRADPVLLVGKDGKPPMKTDKVLRTYSADGTRARSWLQALRLLVVGTAGVATGSALVSTGIGSLIACIRSGTVITSCVLTFSGTKLAVAGVDSLRKLLKDDRQPFERGTTSRCWVKLNALVATVSTTAATLPVAQFFLSIYIKLLLVSRGFVDDMRTTLQSRKLLVHSADQVERAFRRVYGAELSSTLQEKFSEALALADKHLAPGSANDLSRQERNTLVATLSFKLPLSYAWCAGALLLPFASAKLIVAPLVGLVLRRVPRAFNRHARRVESFVEGRLRHSHRSQAPFLAACGQVGWLLFMCKPWGLLGERLAVVPTVRVRYSPTSGIPLLSALEFPEICVPGLQPGQLDEAEVASSIPWIARNFLQ